MTDVDQLIIEYLDIWTSATKKKSGAGRGNNGAISLYGINKLREFIIELAVRGRLVEQQENEGSAVELLSKSDEGRKFGIKKKLFKKQNLGDELGKDDFLYELPDNWKWARLGDIGFIYSGNSVSGRAKSEKYCNPSDLPFVATKNVGYGFEPIDYNVDAWIPKGEPKFREAIPNTPLICSEGGSAGKKCGLTDKTVCFGNKLFACDFYDEFHPKFLLCIYQSPSFVAEFSRNMTGIIGGISLAKFLRLAIPVPPKEEQERIVEKVDELMQLCHALERHTKNSLDTHNTLVETILTDFTSGSAPEYSTPIWPRMAKHFDTLFTTNESIEKLKNTVLELAFSGFLNTSNAACSYEQKHPFKNHKLGQMLKHNCGISYGVIKLGVEPEDGGVSTLRCSDVKPGYIVRSNVRRVSHEIEREYLRTRLKGGEVVLNIRGTLGGVAKVPVDMEGFNVAREVAVIPIGDQILADYLVYFLRSPTFWIYLENNLRGIAYKGLNLGILRELEIPLPDLETQTQLVGLIDIIFKTCDSICDSLEESNQKAGQFLDSLLDRFGGTQACV